MNSLTRTSFILAAFVLGLSGCSSYEVVKPAPKPVRIALLPVNNTSDLPRIIAPLARNLRERLAHSPNWELVDADRAEARLLVTVTDLDRQAISRNPQDTGRPLSFREEVMVEVEWKSSLPCPWGPSNTFVTSSDHIIYAHRSLPDASESAIAALADRIAAKIVDRMDWNAAATSP